MVRRVGEPGLEDLVRRNSAEGRLSFSADVPAAIASAEIIFIAVGTPMRPDGAADLSAVDAVAKTAFDNGCHQNTTYWTATSVQRLFERAGVKLVDVERISTFGGSLRLYLAKQGEPSAAATDMLRDEAEAGAVTLPSVPVCSSSPLSACFSSLPGSRCPDR